MKPTQGRTVLYILSEDDVRSIETQRQALIDLMGGLIKREQIGMPVKAGGILPMIITHVESAELVNGKVILDGTDQHWVVSSQLDSTKRGAGTWHWPEVAKPASDYVSKCWEQVQAVTPRRHPIHDTETLAGILHDAHAGATMHADVKAILLWQGKVRKSEYINECQAWRHVATIAAKALS
jgi:hypothetical protein